jgi:hypothetical protein
MMQSRSSHGANRTYDLVLGRNIGRHHLILPDSFYVIRHAIPVEPNCHCIKLDQRRCDIYISFLDEIANHLNEHEVALIAIPKSFLLGPNASHVANHLLSRCSIVEVQVADKGGLIIIVVKKVIQTGVELAKLDDDI